MTDASVLDPNARHADDTAGGHDAHHPPDVYYVRIAAILGVITAVEVGWSYIDGMPTWLRLGGLLGMMAVKFAMVALHFMHLKFDSKLLTRVFYTGLTLAVVCYLIALSTFHIFSRG